MKESPVDGVAGRALKVLRHHKMSIKRFAHQAGMPYAGVLDMMNGYRPPSIAMVAALKAQFNGLNLVWLYTGLGASGIAGLPNAKSKEAKEASKSGKSQRALSDQQLIKVLNAENRMLTNQWFYLKGQIDLLIHELKRYHDVYGELP